jgi:hypothetical protein
METATRVKRPRGRPRIDAPLRPAVHVRLTPGVKGQLERDAKRANRSVTKEIEVRLEKSYLRDEMYGGPQMAAMFREMANVALGVAGQKNRGSFFEDFEVFVLVRNVWQIIIQRQMPRPADELLAEVSRKWDAFKAGAPQTHAQAAAREWLIQHTPMTLAEALAGTFEPGISSHAETSESVSDKPAETTEAAAAGEPDMPPKPLSSRDKIPALGSLAQAIQHLIPSEFPSGSFSSSAAVRPIGSLAMVLQGFTQSQGNARAAAQEIARLVGLLAEMTEGEAASDTAVPRAEPDSGIAAARGNSPG